MTIPIDGPAGNLRFVVQVDSGDAVLESNETNNFAAATNATTVPLALTLSLSATQVREDAGSAALLATVTRNGPRTNALLVALSSSDTNELTVSTAATIPSNQSSVSFPVAAVRDGVVDGPKQVTFSASAPGFTIAGALVTMWTWMCRACSWK